MTTLDGSGEERSLKTIVDVITPIANIIEVKRIKYNILLFTIVFLHLLLHMCFLFLSYLLMIFSETSKYGQTFRSMISINNPNISRTVYKIVISAIAVTNTPLVSNTPPY